MATMSTAEAVYGNNNDLALVVALSEGAATASQALQIVKDQIQGNKPAALQAAVLVQDLDEDILVFDVTRADPHLGARFGSALGGLLWALSGYGGDTGHTKAMGPGGRETSSLGDGDLDAFLAALQSGFVPGGSALVVLADKEAVETMSRMLAGLQVQILQLALTDDSWTRLTGGEGFVAWPGDAGG